MPGTERLTDMKARVSESESENYSESFDEGALGDCLAEED